MTIRVELKNVSKKTNEGSIYIVADFYEDGKREKRCFKTSIKVGRNQFSTSEQKVNRSHPRYKELNSFIEVEKINVIRLKQDIEHAGKIFCPSTIDEELKKRKELNQKTDVKDIIGLMKEYIDNKKSLTKKNKEKYQNLITRMEYFQKGKKLYEDDFNQNWIDNFKHYLSHDQPECENKNIRNAQAPNTIHRTFTFLKTLLKGLYDLQQINIDCKRFDYPKKIKIDFPIFSREEIIKLVSFPLNNEKLEKTRDFCLVQLFTGLRYSDVIAIKPHHVVDGRLKIQNKKTLRTTSLPIHDKLDEVLKKYEYDMSKIAVTNQVLNRNMKELLETIGINSLVEITVVKNNQKVRLTKPKYEVLGTHSNRRSFVSHLASNNFPLHSIQQYTGHSTLKQLSEYVHLTNDMTNQEVEKLNSIFSI